MKEGALVGTPSQLKKDITRCSTLDFDCSAPFFDDMFHQIYRCCQANSHLQVSEVSMPGPSQVTQIFGEVAADGAGISLQLSTQDSICEVVLAKDDIAGLIFMLLTLAGDSGECLPERPAKLSNDLPVNAVWVGEANSGDGLLGVEIGGVKLTFSLPQEELARIGNALLCASVSRRLPA